MKMYYISFGDHRYKALTDEAYRIACASNVFERCTIYHEEDLSEELMSKSVMEEKTRFGFWTWKADVILNELRRISDDDVLVYADADVHMLPNAKGWQKVVSTLSGSRFLYVERLYQSMLRMTKRSVLDAVGLSRAVAAHLRQLSASFIVLRKCEESVAFIRSWFDMMTGDSGFLVRDILPTESEQYPGFLAHRYDQAVFSACVYSRLSREQVLVRWENFVNRSPFGGQIARDRKQGTNNLYSRCRYLIKRWLVRPLYSVCDGVGLWIVHLRKGRGT